MPLFDISADMIRGLDRATFGQLGLLEREDLQRLLRDQIEVIAEGVLVIAEEFSNWDRSDRRIDLLCVDRQARLVVIELKRTTDDRQADLQALRYAAMVSQMTFDEAVEAYRGYLTGRGRADDPQSSLLEFLGWADPGEGRFGEDVRIVLAAADFSPEVTSTVLWLNDHDLDIRCVRMQPYRNGESMLLDVQQIIPLPEALDYQVQIRQKQREARAAAEHSADWTRYDVQTGNVTHERLYKREVMFAVCHFLAKAGVSPMDIESTVGRKLFEVVPGQVNGEAFREELVRRRPNDRIAAKRFFTDDEQLIFDGGSTYALSNQWNKDTMEAAMAKLLAQYSSLGLSYQPAERKAGAE